MQLPRSISFSQMLTQWAAILNPVIADTIIQGNNISNVSLTASTPKAINHLLARKQQGWFLTDNTANSTVWRTQPFNDKTLTLQASVDTTISIRCF